MALEVGEPLAGDVADLLELERPQGPPPALKPSTS